jgi:hypothetical protein
MSTTKLVQRIRSRRNSREFERALRNASPAMRQELLAISSRDFSR